MHILVGLFGEINANNPFITMGYYRSNVRTKASPKKSSGRNKSVMIFGIAKTAPLLPPLFGTRFKYYHNDYK